MREMRPHAEAVAGAAVRGERRGWDMHRWMEKGRRVFFPLGRATTPWARIALALVAAAALLAGHSLDTSYPPVL